MDSFKRDTVFYVEATNHERHTLWRDFADDKTAREHGAPTKNRVSWEQLNPGSMPTVGLDNKRPITVVCTWARINGQIVMFYEPTSQIVNWKTIEAWLEKEYAHVPLWNGRRAQCDAERFSNCLAAIAQINEKAAKAS